MPPTEGVKKPDGAPRKRVLRRYLVAGVLVWLPILATIWVVDFMLHLMDRTLLLLPPAYRPEALLGFSIPGAGLALALVLLLLTGLLVTNLIGHRLERFARINDNCVLRSFERGELAFHQFLWEKMGGAMLQAATYGLRIYIKVHKSQRRYMISQCAAVRLLKR